MHPLLPLTRDLVLIGGGHTHALVLHAWSMRPLPGVNLTVINPDATAPYTGMLPGYIAGHYSREDLDIDLVRLARRAGARLIKGRATGIDRAQKLIMVSGRPAVAYDVASVDIGITSDLPSIAGYREFAVSAKPLGAYARAWESWLSSLASGETTAKVAIIGGGVAGVELALAMAYRLKGRNAEITIIDAQNLLPNIGTQARSRLLKHLARAGIRTREQQQISEITNQGVRLGDGTTIEASLILGAAGARPQDWLKETGLDLTSGFLTVDTYLRSVSDPDIFAVGDCAHMAHAPRAKAGVYAVRQAPFLLDNLRAALGAGRMRAYHPQRDYLKLVSLGDKVALADKWSLPLEGRWLWRLKDRIDAKFMGQFRETARMSAPLPPAMASGLKDILEDRPLCGGCGAKLGAEVLTACLPTKAPAGARIGIGDDAAILQTGPVAQAIATDHLRAMVSDPYVMAQIAANHALGDIWAMGARPQAALASVTIPRMTPALQARTLREILEGANVVLEQARVELVGGHSAMGAEMQIGFTVTGLLEGPPLTKTGARAGDALILTKPLGTGVIMAAEMQGAAQGEIVMGAVSAMLQPQGRASAVLAQDARAMTDVTGFGLAGHLMEMLVDEGLGADIRLNDLPVLDGVQALLDTGHASNIAALNKAAVAHVLSGRSADILFDPQTAGGLLAAIPEERAEKMIELLKAEGYQAAIIGHVFATEKVKITVS